MYSPWEDDPLDGGSDGFDPAVYGDDDSIRGLSHLAVYPKMSDIGVVTPAMTRLIAELSRRPSLEQYSIVQEENRLLREEVLRVKAELAKWDPEGSFW